ncbi:MULTISPECIES: hypothetical protein [Streptomyces]|uniref:Uncharacterized protein n=1 Tax=Streptomyces pseudovenezuelae TaxID=67350 RepID=A0A101N3C8_9ACTN|nr:MULTISPECIES: hypothetical protein [Streptomyces]KUM85797.1 hypothetical protein AQI94_24610 [Streptomyces pseudovenezuelae]
MGRWVVLVDRSHGDQQDVDEVAHFEGTREEARARLYELACTHRPGLTLRQKRRHVYRIGDGDAYYAHIEGVLSTHCVVYRLGELAWSTHPESWPWAWK